MLENILSICVLFSVMAALYQTNISFHTTQIKPILAQSFYPVDKIEFIWGQTSKICRSEASKHLKTSLKP